MPETQGRSPAPKSVTRIDPLVPRAAAVAVPIVAVILLVVGGRRLGEFMLLWGVIVLLLLAVSAVLAYMVWNGQFPPRISKEGSDLPAKDVKDTGASLELLQKSLRKIAERVERIEAHAGLEEDEAECSEDAVYRDEDVDDEVGN
jgi:hypothetical protein